MPPLLSPGMKRAAESELERAQQLWRVFSPSNAFLDAILTAAISRAHSFGILKACRPEASDPGAQLTNVHISCLVLDRRLHFGMHFEWTSLIQEKHVPDLFPRCLVFQLRQRKQSICWCIFVWKRKWRHDVDFCESSHRVSTVSQTCSPLC